jgi:hypothetical protein
MAIVGRIPVEWDALLTKSALNARERFLRDRGTKDAVFHAVAEPDIAVVRALVDRTLATAGAPRRTAISEIINQYRRTFDAVGATPRQVDSVVRQIETLAGLIGKIGGAKHTRSDKLRRDGLTEIAKALGQAERASDR